MKELTGTKLIPKKMLKENPNPFFNKSSHFSWSTNSLGVNCIRITPRNFLHKTLFVFPNSVFKTSKKLT